MKKLLLSAILCCGAMVMMAQEKTYTALVYVNNPTATTTAYQCDVVLPTSVAVVPGTEATIVNTKSSCDNTFVVATNMLQDNYRIVNYSTSNSTLKHGGPVAQFDVVTTKKTGIKFSIAEGSSEIVNSSCEVENTPNVTVRLQGDCDGNGAISGLDYKKVLTNFKNIKSGSTDMDQYCDVDLNGTISGLDYKKVLTIYKKINAK